MYFDLQVLKESAVSLVHCGFMTCHSANTVYLIARINYHYKNKVFYVKSYFQYSRNTFNHFISERSDLFLPNQDPTLMSIDGGLASQVCTVPIMFMT